jgi:predicted dienelactone hydrolase
LFSHLRSFAAALALSAVTALSSGAMAATVGYQELQIPDPAGGTIEIGIWYPADAPAATRYVGPYPLEVAQDAPVSGRHHGLIVMSHGNGGSFASHVDTSLALAQAGFVAAALTHTGDNYRDQSRAIDLTNRPRQLKVLVDYMLTNSPCWPWPGASRT